MSNTYFKGKRILITGITGFIGSHLSKALKRHGAIVYGISRKEQNGNIYKINILDLKEMETFIKEKKITMCFHLAAESLVEAGQESPHKTFEVNILGTLNVLEAARVQKMEKIIITSTAHVYGENKLPYVETYTPKPTRPYETSKTCIDIIAQSYADSFNLPVLIPRFVNIFGPGDKNFNRLIPKTVKNVLFGINPTMWGGNILRDYLFIDDAIEAYLFLARFNPSDTKSNRVFNFGGGNKITVYNLVKKIIKLSKKNISITKITSERQDEIKKQYVSFAKAKTVLGWTPKVGIDEGLRKTINWYENYFTKTKHT